MKKLLVKAIDIATTAHREQFDKGGHPYILHPRAVAAGVETTEQKIIAYLHDIIEDTSVTADDLLTMGFPESIVRSIQILTKAKGIPYNTYLEKVKTDENARAVKISDLKHNMDISRIQNPTNKDFERLEKYKKALDFLQNA